MQLLSKKELKDFLLKNKNRKIAVVGDVMLDSFTYGTIFRQSPEAPVPIVNIEKESEILGGAANVAKNISALGGKAFLFGVIGIDSEGARLKKILKSEKISTTGLVESKRQTTFKQRILASGIHQVRIDKEVIDPINTSEEDLLLKNLKKNINTIDLIIFSDYAKGVITKSLVSKIVLLAKKHNKPTIVDTKPKNAKFFKNQDIFLFTPNLKEALEISNKDNCIDASKYMLENFGKNILITKGENGMTLYSKNEEKIDLPALAKKVLDVSGCGDTVCATLALCISQKLPLSEAVKHASVTAAIVVGKYGTSFPTEREIIKFYAK